MPTATEKRFLRLEGLSRHGKNRIGEHGERWNVIDDRPREFVIRSLDETNHGQFDLRRIQKENDPDFRIVFDSEKGFGS